MTETNAAAKQVGAMGLATRIRSVFAIDPSRGAVEFRGRWYSWGQLADFGNRIEQLLEQAGIKPGHVVGMVQRSRVAHVPASIFTLISKRCLVALNPFQSPEQLAKEVVELRLPAVIADEEDWAQEAFHLAAKSVGCLGIAIGVNEDGLTLRVLPGFEKVGDGPHYSPQEGIGLILLSSGTTGTPKRIPLKFTSFESAVLDASSYEAGSKDGQQPTLKTSVSFATLPMVHIGGFWTIVLNLAMGRSIVLMEKFNLEEWRAAVVKHRPKLVPLPPTAIRMVFDANVPKEDLSSLIAIRAGTAPLDPEFAVAFEERYGVAILDAYGATEFGGGVAGWTWPDYQKFGKDKRGSVGCANKGCTLRIVDAATGNVLPPSTPGLLEVKSAQVGDGDWVRTNDIAELDEDGFLYIRGRADDAIIRGGFKVHPDKVADALREHPSVADASVVGLPDARLGAVPVAAVELRPNQPCPSEQDLMDFVRQHLVAYQIPVRIKVVDALPRTPSMKVSQPGVKALFAVSD